MPLQSWCCHAIWGLVRMLVTCANVASVWVEIPYCCIDGGLWCGEVVAFVNDVLNTCWHVSCRSERRLMC